MADDGFTFNDYLENAIIEFPEDLPMQKAVLWVEHCIRSSHRKQSPKQILNLLAKLLITYSGSQDFRNSIANKIQKIISMCISSYSNNDVQSSLDCLEIILLKFGSSCFLCKAKIAEYLERFLCSPLNVETITKAGNALHLLQQVGNAGKNGAIHKKQWSDYVHCLCKTMHTLYDVFFENIKEFNTSINEISAESFNFVVEVYSDNKQIAQKLRNVIIFLKCALLKQYPTERSIPFQAIFLVIKRGLMIDEYSDTSAEADEFLHLLYTLQINVLHLLKALVVCGAPGIRKYSEEILKLLTDCLKRTNKQYFTNKSLYQTILYGVLNEYIILEKENLSRSVCDSILSHNLKYIFNVIKPVHESNKIEEITQPEMLMHSIPVNRKLTIANMKCMEAIHAVINLLRNAVLINEDKLDVLYKFGMDHLSSIHNGRSILPYPKYTTDLFKLLNIIRTMPNYCSLPLLNCTVAMFNNDWKNRNEDTCIQGLEAIENLVNPMYPSLTIVKSNSGSIGKVLENETLISHTGSITNNNLESLCVVDYIDITANSNTEETENGISKSYKDNTNIDTTLNNEPPLKKCRMDNIAGISRSSICSDETLTNTPIEQTESDLLVDLSSKQDVTDSNDNNQAIKLLEITESETNAEHCEKDALLNNETNYACEKLIYENTSDVHLKSLDLVNKNDKDIKADTNTDSDDDAQLCGMFKDVPNAEFLNI